MHPLEEYILERDDVRYREEEIFGDISVNGVRFDSPVPTQKSYFLAPKNSMDLVEFTRWSDEFLARSKENSHIGQSRRNTVWRDRIYFPLISLVYTEATTRIEAPQASISVWQGDQELAAYTHDYTQEVPVPTKMLVGCFPNEIFDQVKGIEEGWSREALGALNESFAKPNWLERQVEKYRLRPSKFL